MVEKGRVMEELSQRGGTKPPTNDAVANRLGEIAGLLDFQAANPFRVRAYRRAAATVRQLAVPASHILALQGTEGLDALPGIGPRLARTIRDMLVHGYSPILERLRGETDPIRLFGSLPGIGDRLATRLHDELGLETLEQLESAAHDGRLQNAGFGPKRLAGVRNALAARLERKEKDGRPEGAQEPAVEELLDIDREYREKAQAGELRLITPKRFNPERVAWLPVLHTERGPRHYTALFSNTARAHRLGRTRDWVVLYCDDGPRAHQWTIITSAFGLLRGRRIVRGREQECAAFYGREPVQPAGPERRHAGGRRPRWRKPDAPSFSRINLRWSRSRPQAP